MNFGCGGGGKGAAEVSGGEGGGARGPADGTIPSRPMPPASVMTRLILIMVWRKLIRNPNTYSSLIGLIWSLVAFRWHVAMPKIVENSISILSDAGLGMAMFSLGKSDSISPHPINAPKLIRGTKRTRAGLFMALQPRIIACGNTAASFAMAVRFLAGPAVMAAASIAVGLRGTLLHVAIVQGIVPFVFAKEYNVHPAILSTAVIFGMLIALPITLVYYILLGFFLVRHGLRDRSDRAIGWMAVWSIKCVPIMGGGQSAHGGVTLMGGGPLKRESCDSCLVQVRLRLDLELGMRIVAAG
ncbi:hypothetical protein ZIOFF_011338 [Zingiber officinale]|uniref:Auxin efflux carrier component n=1 Tax=Zingiber officinale TaxID=94328 RepID=A0A8J5LST5_ZINOF|nr:hypothetical protein ZIOFF_011338 [Zingiber officinale]